MACLTSAPTRAGDQPGFDLAAAVHAPQSEVVRECVVILKGNPEVPLAFGALSAEEPVIVDGDVDLEVDVAVVTTSEKLDAIMEPTVAHPSSLHGG
jgi:hypothetical protein